MKKLVAAITCAFLFALCTSVLIIVVVFQQKTIRQQREQIASMTARPSAPRTQPPPQGQDATTRLKNALRTGDINQLRAVLDEDPALLNAPVAGLGGTPLHAAAYTKKVDLVQELLRRNANPNVQDERGTTPLHNAIHASSPEIVALILEAKPDLNLKDHSGLTPLQLAQSKNRPQLVELIQQHAAKN